MKRIVRQCLILITLVMLCTASLILTGCDNDPETGKQGDKGEIVLYNGLTIYESKEYAMFYKLNCNKAIIYLEQEENIDDTKFYADDGTEIFTELFNYRIWDHESEDESTVKDLEEARKICEKYSLTSENRLTSKWVLDEPQNAYKMMNELPKYVRSWLSRDILDKYEKYVKGNEQTSQ